MKKESSLFKPSIHRYDSLACARTTTTATRSWDLCVAAKQLSCACGKVDVQLKSGTLMLANIFPDSSLSTALDAHLRVNSANCNNLYQI